ncbi:alpha/beta hydrolase [Ekhidna sp.]|uniref:alpha/beta hydrolase n=1 Tax=Ekhidna sp. TaxID=2608089 RepID=UPI00329A2D46
MNSLKIFILILISVYLIGGALLYLLQDRFIFLPEPLDQDFQYNFKEDFSEYNLEMKDGAMINALHFNTENARGLIVYFHGNAGNLSRWGEIVTPFVEMGFNVLIPDYRGYGKSTGSRSDKKLLADAEEVYAFAKTLEEEDNIILFGRSLGSAFASHLAGKENPKMLILETPFHSLQDVARDLIPIYPTSSLLSYQFANHKYLEKTTIPIYIFHGTEDEIVPFKSGERLSQSVINAKLIKIESGHHNDLALFEEYWSHMETVLNDE